MEKKNRINVPLAFLVPLRFLPLLPPLTIFFLILIYPPSSRLNETSRYSSFIPASTPTLQEIISTIFPLFHLANLSYFVLPPSKFLPPSPPEYPHPRLPPTEEGIDVGILNNEIGELMTLLPLFDERNFELVETYFGARIFPRDGVDEWGMEHKWPFVDVFYVRVVESNTAKGEKGTSVVSGCCDCGTMMVSSCTKKLCACKKCMWDYNEVYPVVDLKIDGVEGVVRAIRNTTKLYLAKDVARWFG